MSDPIAELAVQPGVAESLAAARAAVDELLWHRPARSAGVALAGESTLLGAWANAAFEGAEVPLDALRGGVVEGGPIGRTAARTVAMYSEVPALADLIGSAPLQALARMAAVVAADDLTAAELGRPRSADEVADPLRLRTAVPAADAVARLRGLADALVSSAAPALALAAIAHAEVAVTQPFGWGSGLVARCLPRVVLRARGVDPDGWSVPEAGIRMLGRPKYVAALRAYATGEPQAVLDWIKRSNEAIAFGARAAIDLVADLPSDQ